MQMHDISEAEIAAVRNSGQFDAQWYLDEYPDVKMIGMDPVEHYLWIGRKLGRKISASGGRIIDNTHWSIDRFIRSERSNIADRLNLLNSPSEVRVDGPTISILMPVYKTPVKYLDKAIKSVLAQTYWNWELCIVDDASNHHEIEILLNKYRDLDKRVKFDALDINSGISVATNRAFAISSGEYIALLDHDDMLTNDALLENVNVIVGDGDSVDMLYSDECKIDIFDTPLDIFQKPDWSPHLLFNSMYTGHFSVYRRELVEAVGGFRTAYDFSQDYDLALRISEKARKIVHIPKVLYGWRMIEGSAASGGKDYARDTNIAALADAIQRRGIGGEALALPTANRVRRTGIIGHPLVSIVIPSDNMEQIEESVRSIEVATSYQNYEIIIVTNSGIAKEAGSKFSKRAKFCLYDEKFNFSRKCNWGAREASGEFLVFFNDDVRVIEGDWIECILEFLTLEEVGVVGPKLVYENGTIQHAGMVTGVRNLVGTAFHCLEKSSNNHYNFVQFVRDVSLVCGACLGVRREVFENIGGWDEGHFAIAHSDVDLCLKVRASGLHCVYTPYASLMHIGHVSIGEEERKTKVILKDKADISLLRKWPKETAHDPFWTEPMRRALYHDSQEFYRIYPGRERKLGQGRDILLATHELTRSGAPRIVKEMANIFERCGDFVVVVSPVDGPLRSELEQMGVTVIIDELLYTGHESVLRFAKNFDLLITNTIVTWPLVTQMSSVIPTCWYLHEGQFMRDLLEEEPGALRALDSGADIWAISNITGSIISDYVMSWVHMPWGVGYEQELCSSAFSQGTVQILVLGSFERRKGQDLAIEAFGKICAGGVSCRLSLHGRVLDRAFLSELETRAQLVEEVLIGPELDRSEVHQAIVKSDIVLVSSREEPLSLVAVEAMAAGRVVVCSTATGIAEFIEDGVSGFVARDATVEGLTDAIRRALSNRAGWPQIGRAARQVFEDQFTLEAFATRMSAQLKRTMELA